MGMHDTDRYRQGQDSAWRAYGNPRDERDRAPDREGNRRHGSDLRYGLNGGYGQETWADDDASWPEEVREDDWSELRPHRFANRQRQPQPGYSDTHYDELRSDRRYWTDSRYGDDEPGDGDPRRDTYREDARQAFAQADDRYFERSQDRGMLYNLGHRIGEVLGEWFGPSESERSRDATYPAHDVAYPAHDVAYGVHSSDRPYAPTRRVGPRNYKRSDERIRDEICERLTFANGVNVGEVSVEVSAGVVTLTGTVERRAQKYDIEDIADNTSGVTEVDNQIRVERQPTDASVAAGFNGW